ncbi:hypothetical protein DXG01_014892 [Tephrocybe rancida]|nr:hypothetical protein DXG01_014892 [Tephrocybe rancida]
MTGFLDNIRSKKPEPRQEELTADDTNPVFPDNRIIMVDMPAFHDTNYSGGESQNRGRISAWLAKSYDSGMKMAGVIYLFDINTTQWQGAIKLDFDTFEQLWGQSSRNVVFVTSMWEKVVHSTVAEQREQELRNELCKDMLRNGSAMHRGYRDQKAAEDTVDFILAQIPTVYPAWVQQVMDEFNMALLGTERYLSTALQAYVKKREYYAGLFAAKEDTHLTTLQQTIRYRRLKDSLQICQAKAATFRSFKSERAKTDPGRLKELHRIYSEIRSIQLEIRDLELVPFAIKLRVFLDGLPESVNAKIYRMTNQD